MSGESLHVAVLADIAKDSGLRTSWNDLAMRVERPEVFYTWEWVLAAKRALKENRRPLICAVYDADRLCGIAALAASGDLPENAFFLTASTADYCDILSEPEQRKAVLDAVFGELRKRGIRKVTLANVPASSITLRELPEIARTHQFHLHERPAYECGLIQFGSAEERQAILETVQRKDRERRGLKKMAQLGTVRICHLTTEQAEQDLPAIFAAQIGRFLATNRVSPLVGNERRSFLTELSRLLGEAGWLKVSRLEIDGRPVAWNFGFRFCESWFWYLPTFDIQHEDLSPGSCLLRLLTEEACADPDVKRLDLGLGEEAYKERFANGICPTRHVELSTSGFEQGKVAARYRVAELVKRSRRVETAIRRTRDWAGGVGDHLRTSGVIGVGGLVLRRATKNLVANDEVFLFEAPQIVLASDHEKTLAPLTWKSLADAAIRNSEDMQTLQYFMRCADRLRAGTASGFVLQNPDLEALHFLWVDRYDGFRLSEIDYRLEAPDPAFATVFDCWTPANHRGHGYYSEAIRLAAESLQRQHKQVWIFSAARNVSSLRGILKAGFVYRFSLVRKTLMGYSRVIRVQRPRLAG